MGDFAGGISPGASANGHGPRGDWIDYRASIANVVKRAEKGDIAITCEVCETEVDVPDVVHRPNCSVLKALQSAPARTRPVEEPDPTETILTPGLDLDEPGMKVEVDAELPPAAKAHVDGARKPKWTKASAIAKVQEIGERLGYVPSKREAVALGAPSEPVAKSLFGGWADLVEASGYPRPKRGRQAGRAARSHGAASIAPERQEVPVTWAVRVYGTGLRYRTPTEAYIAADGVEADGERVAREARLNGQEGQADQAIDASRELAEKIRAAARIVDGEPEPDSAPDTVSGRKESFSHANTAYEEGETLVAEPKGDASLHAKSMPAPSLREALSGLLGSLVVVLEAAQRELLVETSAPGERPVRFSVRPRGD